VRVNPRRAVEDFEDHLSAMIESRRDAVSVAADESELADRLARLAEHWLEPGAKIITLERLSGGASQETWSFDVDARGSLRQLILRRNPGGAVKLDMVAGMETEARLIRLAEQTGAPVPRVVHVLSPEEGLGSGFIMERIEGESLARKLLRDPQYAIARTRMAFQIGAAAARIHQMDPARTGELRRATIRSSLDDATALYRTNGKRRPVVEWALRWLEANRPASDPVPTVVHGDLRTGNFIAGPEGLRAVLDWELVHLGDPMEDLGWACVASWRFGNLDKPAGGFRLPRAAVCRLRIRRRPSRRGGPSPVLGGPGHGALGTHLRHDGERLSRRRPLGGKGGDRPASFRNRD